MRNTVRPSRRSRSCGRDTKLTCVAEPRQHVSTSARQHAFSFALSAFLIVSASGCDNLPGKPTEADRPLRPAQVVDFTELYGENCAGCHGDSGQGGVGPQLAGSGLDAGQVTSAVQQGRGVMPAGLVSGQEQADVVAFVVSISSQSQ